MTHPGGPDSAGVSATALGANLAWMSETTPVVAAIQTAPTGHGSV
jgi:hypothetical protein